MSVIFRVKNVFSEQGCHFPGSTKIFIKYVV